MEQVLLVPAEHARIRRPTYNEKASGLGFFDVGARVVLFLVN